MRFFFGIHPCLDRRVAEEHITRPEPFREVRVLNHNYKYITLYKRKGIAVAIVFRCGWVQGFGSEDFVDDYNDDDKKMS